MTTTMRVSRRDFIKTGAAAGGLVLAIELPGCGPRGRETAATADKPFTPVFEPNAFIRVGDDGTVSVVAKHLEMGQGTYTGLATIVADELDADWKKVRAEGAPADKVRYANIMFGVQGTGGSTSIANSWEQLRKAGATARAMLVAAAAKEWGV